MKQYGSELKDKKVIVMKNQVVILAVKTRIKAGPEVVVGGDDN
jgi:hypothetical protein